MRLPAHCDHRLDASLLAGFHVAGAEIAGVGQQMFDLAKFLGQRAEHAERVLAARTRGLHEAGLQAADLPQRQAGGGISLG